MVSLSLTAGTWPLLWHSCFSRASFTSERVPASLFLALLQPQAQSSFFLSFQWFPHWWWGVCAALNLATFPHTSTSVRGEASPTAPPDVANNEPAVQRRVREVGPGPGGRLSVHGESKNNHQKRLVIVHSATSCHKRKELNCRVFKN